MSGLILKKKVGVIDDDDSIREIYKTALEAAGFDVVTAANGEEGFNVLKTQAPDIALIDIMMPVKNGIELMKEIRADKDLSSLPIVVMTNFDDQKIIEQVEEFDTRFYLVKSLFDPQKMVGIVKEALHRH